MNAATRAAAPYRSRSTLGDTIRAIARDVDAWLGARARAARDHDALASMSDRELRDIGLDRGVVDAVASGRWTRE